MVCVNLSDVLGEKLTDAISYQDSLGSESVVLYFGDKYVVLESYSAGYDHETGISIRTPSHLDSSEIELIEQKLGDKLVWTQSPSTEIPSPKK